MDITKVTCSYGCSIQSYTQKPIAPGTTGTIQVAFDSNGRKGKFKKGIDFFCDGKFKYQQLFLEGFIQIE